MMMIVLIDKYVEGIVKFGSFFFSDLYLFLFSHFC